MQIPKRSLIRRRRGRLGNLHFPLILLQSLWFMTPHNTCTSNLILSPEIAQFISWHSTMTAAAAAGCCQRYKRTPLAAARFRFSGPEPAAASCVNNSWALYCCYNNTLSKCHYISSDLHVCSSATSTVVVLYLPCNSKQCTEGLLTLGWLCNLFSNSPVDTFNTHINCQSVSPSTKQPTPQTLCRTK